METQLSHLSVIGDDENGTIWGVDAQEQWKRIAADGLLRMRNGSVMLTGPRAVEELLKRPDILSSNPDAAYFGEGVTLLPLQVDPPEHVRYRRILDPLFSPQKMALREPAVTALTNELIDKFVDRGTVDFAKEFAVPLPCSVFLELLGLPQSDLDQFLKIKDDMIRPAGTSEEENNKIRNDGSMWMAGYFSQELDRRASEPKDDLLSYLVGLEAAEKLNRMETLNICFLQLMAGLDTVTDTLECSFAFLAQHPEHRRQLVDDPSLVPGAVEELLRYETPVPGVARVAIADAESHGCPITKGERVGVLLAGYNHDPELFPNPDVVDFQRPGNKHFSFGAGVHRCLGSHLARLELRVAMREWHRRIPDYRLPEGHELRYTPSLREITYLPLEFTKA